MNQLFSRIQRGSSRKNTSGAERWLSLAAGAVALGYAFRNRSRARVPLMVGAASLLQRGATGFCSLYKLMGIDRSGEHHPHATKLPKREVAAA